MNFAILYSHSSSSLPNSSFLVFGQAWWVASCHAVLNRMLKNAISLLVFVFSIDILLFTIFFFISILGSLVAVFFCCFRSSFSHFVTLLLQDSFYSYFRLTLGQSSQKDSKLTNQHPLCTCFLCGGGQILQWTSNTTVQVPSYQ